MAFGTLDQYDVNATVNCLFTTNAASGASVAPSSALENADVLVYKNGSATQRSSVSGITMTSPFDSITGLHLIVLDLSDNTDAGFYAAGSEYTLVLSPDETVDSQAIVAIIGKFRIGPVNVNVQQLLGTAWATPNTAGLPDVNAKQWNALTTVALPLIPTVAGRTLDVSATGEGGVDWANVGTPSTAVNLSGTTVKDVSATGLDLVLMSDIAAVPGITGSIKAAINWLFVLARNKRTQTATTETVTKDDSATSLATSTKSDDGVTFSRGKYS